MGEWHSHLAQSEEGDWYQTMCRDHMQTLSFVSNHLHHQHPHCLGKEQLNSSITSKCQQAASGHYLVTVPLKTGSIFQGNF